MNFTDVEYIRARLAGNSIPTPVIQEYLQILGNLNALSILLSPGDDEEMDGPEQMHLEKLYRAHRTRRAWLEAEYPALALAAKPRDWAEH
ncbi:hypothetical protein GO986_00765 [Deinococcus sp. HMF7620]|uniref:Uncharacterized protein n=1 Tax=Deinococcus arboris TaxID=2682977 RepID=A0A7C9LZH6_9DEIO|nr:hypothetical protein [Deinococcus arboris]MVN85302.1 hypothetical protein [Deinococcus arboris]